MRWATEGEKKKEDEDEETEGKGMGNLWAKASKAASIH